MFFREISHLAVIRVGSNGLRRNVVLNRQLRDQFSKDLEARKR